MLGCSEQGGVVTGERAQGAVIGWRVDHASEIVVIKAESGSNVLELAHLVSRFLLGSEELLLKRNL
jgi:hypothetical protein